MKKLLSRITIIGLAFLVSGIVRTFLLQTYYIPTVSMKPTLNVEDRVLVLKYDAFINNLVYGDIIVFQLDGVGGQSILQDYLDSININIIMNPELANEVYIFVALFFFITCFAMSRYSIYLEKKLHTGH